MAPPTIVMHIEFLDGRPNGKEDERGWSELERVARITGVEGTGYEKMVNALKYKLLPKIGDEHPNVKNLLCTQREPSVIDLGAVDVRLVYERRNDFPSITVGTAMITVETDVDSSGNDLVVEYDGEKQDGVVTIPASVTTIDVHRREEGDPIDKSIKYVGTFNSGEWKIGRRQIGTLARTWQCTGYTGTSVDGKWFDCDISFRRAPHTGRYGDNYTYDQNYQYTDPATGKLPTGVIDGSAAVKALAKKTWTAYPLTDFNEIIGSMDFS